MSEFASESNLLEALICSFQLPARVPQVRAARWRGALLDRDVQAGAQARCSAGQPAVFGPQRP